MHNPKAIYPYNIFEVGGIKIRCVKLVDSFRTQNTEVIMLIDYYLLNVTKEFNKYILTDFKNANQFSFSQEKQSDHFDIMLKTD